MLEILELLVPKVHWGKKNMWKKFQKFGKAFDDLAKGVIEPTLSNLLLLSKRFQILPLDGGPQHLIHVKLCYFKLGQRFYKVVDRNIYVTSILICLKFNRYPD